MFKNLAATLGVGVICLAAGFAGCVKSPAVQEQQQQPYAWVADQSGAYTRGRERVFYGIGKASGTRSITLLRATADNQAQAEMARVLKAYMSALAQSSKAVGSAELEQALLIFTNTAARKAQIVDHWLDPRTNTLYALSRLDLSTFRQLLQTDPQLGSALRNEMLGYTEQVHDQMAGQKNP